MGNLLAQNKSAGCFSAADAVHTIEWIANFDWSTVLMMTGNNSGAKVETSCLNTNFSAKKSARQDVINAGKPGTDDE